MGRDCGWIALYVALCYNVDICLLPEYPTDETKLMKYVHHVMQKKGHCLIVVAEGVKLSDCDDIGMYLKNKLESERYHVKYIDPTYMVRAVPANTNDSIYCKMLSQSAVHACMSGYSDFTVGNINNKMSIIPLQEMVESTNFVRDSMWIRFLQSNLQPDLS